MQELGLTGERREGKGNADKLKPQKMKSQWPLKNWGRHSLGLSTDCSKAWNYSLEFRETGVYTPLDTNKDSTKATCASVINVFPLQGSNLKAAKFWWPSKYSKTIFY